MPRFATIGFFDGVHRGHRCLLDQLKEEASRMGMEPMVVTFRQHPREVIGHGQMRPQLLTTLEERIALLHEAGIAKVEVLEFTPGLAKLTAGEFLREVLLPRGVKGLLMGFNHRFGSDRGISFSRLQAQASEMGVIVRRALPLGGGEDVSSTRIRQAVKDGKMDEAAALLGRAYMLSGMVVAGKQIGRTMGFPTANVLTPADKLLPADGVYIGKVTVQPADTYLAIINIGTRPTVEVQGRRTVEAHLLDFSGNLYGQGLTLQLDCRLRDERSFPDKEALAVQLDRDRHACLDYYSLKR